ncbi:MAG TPA: hypothetical protein VJU54_12150, partial [Nitrospiraceae bacterium]|nr:hypothetical protein [Nitrospiraceae bacterium]
GTNLVRAAVIGGVVGGVTGGIETMRGEVHSSQGGVFDKILEKNFGSLATGQTIFGAVEAFNNSRILVNAHTFDGLNRLQLPVHPVQMLAPGLVTDTMGEGTKWIMESVYSEREHKEPMRPEGAEVR